MIMINYQKKVTDISGNLFILQNTVNAMKTKTDYITITDNDFYIKNPNNKINLECDEFNIRATDGIIYGEIKINSTILWLYHSTQDIKSDNTFSVRGVLCNDLEVIGNAKLPKINSRP